MVAKRALLAALTAVGLVLLVAGAWFTVNLGSSGSATFTSVPDRGTVVVVQPSLLNRVDRPVTITASAAAGTKLWIGRTTPSDAQAVVGGADRTVVTGAHVRDWRLVQSRSGAGPAPDLAAADLWRQTVSGTGRVRINLTQGDAPESVVIAAPDGSPADLSSLTVTFERRTWFFQALLVTLVGLLAVAAGAAGLWHFSPRSATSTPAEDADTPSSQVAA